MEPIAVILPAVLVLIALAAPRYGVDSRLPGPGEPPRPPRRPPTITHDLVVLARGLRQAWAFAFHSH